MPSIPIGETGIGKTVLIKYLAALMLIPFKILNVHAGVTSLEI